MINGGFTVPEFIELLVASVLAGLLTGSLLICLCVRYRNRRRLRQQDSDNEIQNKAHQSGHSGTSASVIDVRRQTPTIPIQTPPPDEDVASSARGINIGLRAEAGYSPAGRPSSNFHSDNPETPSSQLVSRTFPSVVVIPTFGESDLPSPRAFSIRNNRQSRHNHIESARNSNQGAMGSVYHDRSLGSSTGADLSLSRTTTTASTLPLYDTLSSGPPRYPSFQRSSNSLSLTSPDQPSPSLIPPLPPHPWWTKQDSSVRN